MKQNIFPRRLGPYWDSCSWTIETSNFAAMATTIYCPIVPMAGTVQQPPSVVPICPCARPADRAPVYLMFLLNKSEDQTVDQQVHVRLCSCVSSMPAF